MATSIATWAAVFIYLVLLSKHDYFKFKTFLIVNVIKIITSALIMVLFLHFGINFFEDNLIYDNYYKSFYLIMLIVFAAIIFLIISNLLGVLKLKILRQINMKEEKLVFFRSATIRKPSSG